MWEPNKRPFPGRGAAPLSAKLDSVALRSTDVSFPSPATLKQTDVHRMHRRAGGVSSSPPTSGRSREVKRDGRVRCLGWCSWVCGSAPHSPLNSGLHNSSRPEVAQGTRTGLGQLWLADHQFGPLATVDPPPWRVDHGSLLKTLRQPYPGQTWSCPCRAAKIDSQGLAREKRISDPYPPKFTSLNSLMLF